MLGISGDKQCVQGKVKGKAGCLGHGMCGGKGRHKKGDLMLLQGACELSDGIWGFIL